MDAELTAVRSDLHREDGHTPRALKDRLLLRPRSMTPEAAGLTAVETERERAGDALANLRRAGVAEVVDAVHGDGARAPGTPR